MKTVRIIFAILVILALLLQAQPFIVHARGGVDGSFGIRLRTHQCLGLDLPAEKLSFLPAGRIEFYFALFHFLYDFDPQMDRDYCIGQDVWFGE